MNLYIEHDAATHQFVAIVEGKSATLSYRLLPGEKVMDYYSTFTPPELRGRHIAQDIVQFALDYALENGYTIIPSCSFVKSYLDRHPEYQQVVRK